MKKYAIFFLTFLIYSTTFGQVDTQISLAGKWQVRLDSLNVGIRQNWTQQPFIGTSISLPGTLDDAGLGTASTLKPVLNNYVLSNLTRKHQYIGVAYYQREINIPSDWKNK